ncbi:MAG: radical SAM protein [Vicinamibacteraceae bacterium]|nr:radical SAM protein [Vicinamibacteraceae bacterium]
MTTCASLSADHLMPLHEGVIYGPIASRRLGTSLGVNLLPPRRKICTFNCLYCQYGWTAPPAAQVEAAWPSVTEVIEATSAALASARAHGTVIDRMTLAGHGEPTLHPDFPEVVAALRELRDREAPRVRLAILSNATTIDRARIRQALLDLDERFLKLDGGDADTLRHVNAAAVDVERLITSLSSLRPIVVQTMLVRDCEGIIDNTTPAARASYLAAIARIAPASVHIYTLARTPALARLEPAPAEALHACADGVRALGIEARVFG